MAGPLFDLALALALLGMTGYAAAAESWISARATSTHEGRLWRRASLALMALGSGIALIVALLSLNAP